ncbi:hypothetical protein [Aporhodopirellula aestuarii]|uniref:Secreted protein n=1 Tax=Aporhodopirellula aestuarii TaxID=2950107 RepID=A0ABT0TX16_9BACT|nr:hypothetical protein [Aporhodopirellula aestuarii]MCM2369026.1 hypothetical protein [Aporhodopirellula aestuarii]
MIPRQLLRRLAALFCVCVPLIVDKPCSADELLTLHLNRVTPGEFPAQHWYPDNRPSITDQREAMVELVEMLSALDDRTMKELKIAHADRALMVRDWEMTNLKARIDRLCQTHQPIIDKLKAIRWSNAANEIVPFEIVSVRYQIQALAYLTNLYAIREFSEGRVKSASQTLAGGYAFAHNLMRTTGTLNVVMGIVLQSVMTNAIADLQSLGSPDMRAMLSRLDASQMAPQALDHSIWKEVCESMPVLIDRPRTPSEWREDVAATLQTFKRADLTPNSNEEAERLGRQLQTMVQTRPRVKALSISINYEHGGLEEVQTLKPGQQLRMQMTMNIPALAEYVDTSLDKSVLDRAQNDFRRRLCGLRCVEVLRIESAKRGRWLSDVTADLLEAFPNQRGTNLKPTLKIEQGLNGLPSYEIRLPETDFLAGFFKPSHQIETISVSIQQDFPR